MLHFYSGASERSPICSSGRIHLFNGGDIFVIVFFMDSTYKINRYKLPLLEIVGVTCIGLTFSTAFAYMKAKHEKTVWALERFKGLFHRHDELPKVIITSKGLALMNAVKIMFHIIGCANFILIRM